MTIQRTIKLVPAVVICAAATAQYALGAGEQKNMLPFTDRAIAAHSLQASTRSDSSASTAVVGGSKNVWPFAKAIAAVHGGLYLSPKPAEINLAGEAKNELPFTSSASR